MVQSDHAQLSILRQCILLKINRSTRYYAKKGESSLNLLLMKEIGRILKMYPFFGVCSMHKEICQLGYIVNVKRIRRLMCKIGLRKIYHKPETS